MALLITVATACRPSDAAPADPASTPVSDPAAPPGDPTAVSMDGAALYAKYCALCHGADGLTVDSVKNAPHLNSQGLLTVADDVFLFQTIKHGRPGAAVPDKPGTKMPAYGVDRSRILDDRQIEAIVAHIRAWQTEPSVTLEPYTAEGDPATGAALYAEACATCHGPDGWGIEAPRLAGETFQATASDAFIRHATQHGRAGTEMKAFPYDETQLADLIAFIRTLDDAPAGRTD
jgi:cytochrome c oxidase cbb3-type subunit 3